MVDVVRTMGVVNIALALTTLAILPPGLMGAAHAYALRSQDKKDWCVVLLDNRVRSVDRIVNEHRKRYGVVVVQTWDAATKGYRAHIPIKHLEALRGDRRVQIVEMWEQDDLAKHH